MHKRIPVVVLALFASLAVAGDKILNMPPAAHAKTYPLSEAHDAEQVSIAIDPYDEQAKAAGFKGKYKENGFLVLRLVISNDSAKTLILSSIDQELSLISHLLDDVVGRITLCAGDAEIQAIGSVMAKVVHGT